MDDPRVPRMLYGFLVLACLLMMAYYYPLMPQRMASHFTADGSPNGWQPRGSFFLLTIFLCASSAVVAFFAPWQIASRGTRINLPNREYWLAPERRETTMRYIASTMSWFGCGLLFVLISGSFLALRANLAPDHRFHSEAMLAVIGAFLLSLMALMLSFIRHFQHTRP